MTQIVEGNLINMALAGEFDVIGHGCNCFCVQGAGIAVQMNTHFGTNDPKKYPLEAKSERGNPDKLGKIQGHTHTVKTLSLEVLNIYSQWLPGVPNFSGIPLDYKALELAMRQINYRFSGKHIGLPWIGCGLAGGDSDIVYQILNANLLDMKCTIVTFKP